MNTRRQVLLATLAGTAPSIFAADSGVSDSEVLLGQSAVLSGPLGVSLMGFNAGAKLVFDELNAKGGVAGRKLRLISLDDELTKYLPCYPLLGHRVTLRHLLDHTSGLAGYTELPEFERISVQ